jgi:phosphoglycolate phosphatase
MVLLLFDIDGTLLVTQGSGRRSIEGGLERVFGFPISTRGVRFSGKTDRQILREVLSGAGLDISRLDGQIDLAYAAYEEAIHASLEPGHVSVLPGVRELVAHLHDRRDVQLGLLTGNMESVAYLKLRAVELDAFFPFGSFGNDSEHRGDLPAIAVERAGRYNGHTYSGKNVVIIGDTTLDVRCGDGIGAFSVAVCTGSFPRADLEAACPDLLLDDLADIEAFVRYAVERA